MGIYAEGHPRLTQIVSYAEGHPRLSRRPGGPCVNARVSLATPRATDTPRAALGIVFFLSIFFCFILFSNYSIRRLDSRTSSVAFPLPARGKQEDGNTVVVATPTKQPYICVRSSGDQGGSTLICCFSRCTRADTLAVADRVIGVASSSSRAARAKEEERLKGPCNYANHRP
jgi:hypothetical protein